MTSVIRAFIAINLSAEVHQRLNEVLKQLRGKLLNVPVRWVPVQNIHLTLKFLGDIPLVNLESLEEVLSAEAKRHSPFEIGVQELGAFPSIQRAKVIWVGIESSEELAALQRGIEIGTAQIGYPPEERRFSPHLTLGRVARHITPSELRSITEVMRNYSAGFLGVSTVEAIHLYRSDLSPEGAMYTPLFSAPLSQ